MFRGDSGEYDGELERGDEDNRGELDRALDEEMTREGVLATEEEGERPDDDTGQRTNVLAKDMLERGSSGMLVVLEVRVARVAISFLALGSDFLLELLLMTKL